ncbi:hypothetical protein [Lacipirellula parvula]|uniref:Uncharacterized protein n=1 Tax=Lacipirellula parvula TaxID=2650471 RepID=A0A5K7X957_9BACT|nr:hypothetical protein [Lacipirellula parvula]BBO32498.1 hypothetical protein PLANPX_2110 [Lacipirellula parvula]BBO33068.1 hypothetical protein PLANPX_2680 [Lacipirellula parvula]
MDSSVVGGSNAEAHTAKVDGRKINCETLADAIALKIAEHAATVGKLDLLEELTPENLSKIARKYGFEAIADAIEALQ